MKDEAFKAKAGQTLKFPAAGKLKCGCVLLVGLGDGEAKASDSRKVAIEAVRACKGQKSLAVLATERSAEAVRCAAEGFFNGSYVYGAYKTGDRKPKERPKTAILLVPSTKGADASKDEALRDALAAGKIVGEAVSFARDLVNAPPNDMNPPALADAAKSESDKHGIDCEVWDKKRIAAEKMNLFLAVNRGSAVEPRLVHMRYVPKGAKKRVVFVGKGLTFDSGGLCIKPAQSMNDMKCDMAGAATTIGIVVAAARLGLSIEVHGIVGSTENMTGADAFRPGDIFTSREGKTVEIINTDAEGRLVLADVLAYATTLEPDFLVDHATLTGACMVGLGQYTAGFFAADEELSKRYLAAAEADGELFWRLPLQKELRASLDSDTADIKHTGGRLGGAITAALFLKEFVGESKWAHVDIAGPAFVDHAFDRSPKGGTGFGISTGVRFLEALASEG
ncbi:MAG: leucyl aminopeptidase [Polyangiaceae bacterium]|nr:leucyl aminopeptidase [Polyangiaceae bacterium]